MSTVLSPRSTRCVDDLLPPPCSCHAPCSHLAPCWQMTAAVEARVQSLLASHSKASQNLERLVKDVLSEVEGVRAQARNLDVVVAGLRRGNTETQEALFRMSQVFAAALRIEPPISPAYLSAQSSQPPAVPLSIPRR